MIRLFAQAVSSDALVNLIPQFGFGGILLYVIVKWLERIERLITERMASIEHTMRGLSKAMWMDLAGRENVSDFIKNEAKRMLVRLEEKDGKNEP